MNYQNLQGLMDNLGLHPTNTSNSINSQHSHNDSFSQARHDPFAKCSEKRKQSNWGPETTRAQKRPRQEIREDSDEADAMWFLRWLRDVPQEVKREWHTFTLVEQLDIRSYELRQARFGKTNRRLLSSALQQKIRELPKDEDPDEPLELIKLSLAELQEAKKQIPDSFIQGRKVSLMLHSTLAAQLALMQSRHLAVLPRAVQAQLLARSSTFSKADTDILEGDCLVEEKAPEEDEVPE